MILNARLFSVISNTSNTYILSCMICQRAEEAESAVDAQSDVFLAFLSTGEEITGNSTQVPSEAPAQVTTSVSLSLTVGVVPIVCNDLFV